MTDKHELEIEAGKLRWRCNPDRLGYETTDEVPCCTDIIGQDRAVEAIRLGLEITSPGYNIYVSGLTGTGKSTTIKQLLRSIEHGKKELSDLCYVYNFRSPEMPQWLRLPAGKGIEFKRGMSDVLKTFLEHIPKTLESEGYIERQKEVVERLKEERTRLATDLEKQLTDKGFRFLEVQYGPYTRPAIVPVVDEQPVEMAALAAEVESGKLDEKEFERIKQDHEALTSKMEEFLKAARAIDRELAQK
ncbi:MAG: AAA family ATPase, partial [Candidatus Krumholzibacteria bacterium]|nr:AAA family ATPase [Candidatus Krumholzibacteria bacterium]